MRALGLLLVDMGAAALTACSDSESAASAGDGRFSVPEPVPVRDAGPGGEAPGSMPIAERALGGTINGIPVEGFKGWLENGILTLYTGADPNFEFGTKLVLFFVIDEGANQDVVIDQTARYRTGHVHFASKTHDTISGVVTQGMQEIYRDKGWRLLHEPSVPTCGGGQDEQSYGYCDIRYRLLGQSEAPHRCSAVTYVFERDARGEWAITERLPADKKLDVRTGRIERRDPNSLWC